MMELTQEQQDRLVADAAHDVYATEKALEEGDGPYRDVKRARAAFVAACEATTPSATPPTHVLVAVDRLEQLEAMEQRLRERPGTLLVDIMRARFFLTGEET